MASGSYDYPWDRSMQTGDNKFLGNQTPILNKVEDVDISTGDHTASMGNCRYITGLGDGDVKVDFKGTDGNDYTGKTFPLRGGICRVSNVTKVYQTGTSATDMMLVR